MKRVSSLQEYQVLDTANHPFLPPNHGATATPHPTTDLAGRKAAELDGPVRVAFDGPVGLPEGLLGALDAVREQVRGGGPEREKIESQVTQRSNPAQTGGGITYLYIILYQHPPTGLLWRLLLT